MGAGYFVGNLLKQLLYQQCGMGGGNLGCFSASQRKEAADLQLQVTASNDGQGTYLLPPGSLRMLA